MVGHRIDIEKYRARNMRSEIIVDRQRHYTGQLERSVDDLDLRIVDMGGEPVGGDKRIVGGGHRKTPLPSFRDAPLRAGPESITPNRGYGFRARSLRDEIVAERASRNDE